MNTVTLKVAGMSCRHCVSSVKNALLSVPGVATVSVDLKEAQASVVFDPAKTDTATLLKAIEEQGYTAEQ